MGIETNKPTSKAFSEEQSFQVIHEMIQVSKKKIKNDGILILIWGYAMAIMYFINYIGDIFFLPVKFHKAFGLVGPLLPLVALLFSIYYVFNQRKKVKTYIGVSVRYIWIALVLSLVLINLIQFNVMHNINFMLQHPIFMVVIAFATVVTGIILRYGLLITGGLIFAILAYVSSYFALRDQLLFESIAWFVAFIIPGHIMFSKRNK